MAKQKFVDIKIQNYLETLRERVYKNEIGYREASRRYNKMHYMLGIPMIVLSTFVGTSVFATLDKQSSLSIKILLGTISVLAAILAALQTFLKLSEHVEKFGNVATQLGAVRREIDQALYLGIEEDENTFLNNIRNSVDKIDGDSPQLPYRVYKKFHHIQDMYSGDEPV